MEPKTILTLVRLGVISILDISNSNGMKDGVRVVGRKQGGAAQGFTQLRVTLILEVVVVRGCSLAAA